MVRVRHRQPRVSSGGAAGTATLYAIAGLAAVLCVLPFVHILAMSLSSFRAIVSGLVGLWPVEPNTLAYRSLAREGQVLPAMRNTVIVTVVGTAINMLATTMAAYPLSRRRLRGRTLFTWLIIFTMLFSGGLIPTFILVKQLGLTNTYGALWLVGLVSPFNIFVMRTFFHDIPDSLEESAMLDGANDLRILAGIVLPVSMPVIATLTLFYAVGHWNAYMSVLIYITDTRKYTLMMRLRIMITSVSEAMLAVRSGEGTEGSRVLEQLVTPQGIWSAAIVVATVPILLVYPLLQRYFVKGILVGSLKG